jgi:hypothetical protein
MVLLIWSRKQNTKFSVETTDIPTIQESSHVEITHKYSTHHFQYQVYVEVLKRLHEAVRRKRPELWPNDWILHNDNAPAHKMLSVKQFLAHSPDLATNDFWLCPKIKSALKGLRFQDLEDIQKKCDDSTESYSTTGVPKNVSNIGNIVGLNP